MITLVVLLFAPLWVSSRVAFDKNGDLRADLFEPGFRKMLEENRATNADGGCHTALERRSLKIMRRSAIWMR